MKQILILLLLLISPTLWGEGFTDGTYFPSTGGGGGGASTFTLVLDSFSPTPDGQGGTTEDSYSAVSLASSTVSGAWAGIKSIPSYYDNSGDIPIVFYGFTPDFPGASQTVVQLRVQILGQGTGPWTVGSFTSFVATATLSLASTTNLQKFSPANFKLTAAQVDRGDLVDVQIFRIGTDAGDEHRDNLRLQGGLRVKALNSNSGVLLSTGEYTQKNMKGGGLVDENTVVFWDFRNESAGGNEVGFTGTGQGGDLSLVQSGSVAGALNNEPISNFLDDGYHRTLDGVNDYFTAQQIFLDNNNWTAQITFKANSISGNHLVMTHHAGGTSPSGLFLMARNDIGVSHQLQFSINSTSGQIYNSFSAGDPTPFTFTAGVSVHFVLVKTGSNYKGALSTSPIVTSSDFTSNQWFSFSSGQTFGPSNPLRFGAYYPTPGAYGSIVIEWASLSNTARF